MCAHKHLSLDDRFTIQKGLDNSSSRKSIADSIGKDKSTVCKEIIKHSFELKFSHQGVSAIGTYD